MRIGLVTLVVVSLNYIGSVYAAEPLGQTNFAFDEIVVWKDKNGKPSKDRATVDLTTINRDDIELVEWMPKPPMMLVRFGAQLTAWVKKSDIIPPPSLCNGKVQVAKGAATTGGNVNSVTLGSRGLAEKACQ